MYKLNVFVGYWQLMLLFDVKIESFHLRVRMWNDLNEHIM